MLIYMFSSTPDMTYEQHIRLTTGVQETFLLFFSGRVSIGTGGNSAEEFIRDPDAFLRQFGYTPQNLFDKRRIYEKAVENALRVSIIICMDDDTSQDSRGIEIRGLEKQVHDAKWELGLEIF